MSNPAKKFVNIAERVTGKLNAFLAEKNKGQPLTAEEKAQLRKNFNAIDMENIRGARNAAGAFVPTTDEEKADKRKVVPATEKFRQATVKVDRFLTRGNKSQRKSRRNTRRNRKQSTRRRR